MKKLLIIKERIKKFVGKNDVFILPGLKFLLVFMVMARINGELGYMSRLSNGAITLIIALAGSFLPMNLTLVIMALITIAHVYALSIECALLVTALFLILFLLYFRFASKDSVAVLLVPLAFVFKIPYVMPVAMGLVGTLSSMVSTACGVVVYYVLHYISVNADALSSSGSLSLSNISAFKTLVDAILTNKAMIVTVAAFAATVMIVYIIRRLPLAYSWSIAIGTGAVACFVIILIGTAATHAGISLGGAFFGMIISIILNTILQYFCFDLDYNRKENVQFEDDEYYYYVKAVPKNTIKLSDNGKKRAKTSGSSGVSRVTRAERTPARRPEVSQDATRQISKPAISARQAVRSTAANAAKTRTAARGPLGMTGGRPAGEGRKANTDGKLD